MGEPAWVLATYFPNQGEWSDDEFVAFSAARSRLELVHGSVEVLPMPSVRHQVILALLFRVLDAFARRTGGRALPSGLRIRLEPGRFREPDVAFLSSARLQLRAEEYWTGADLVVEIVSPAANDRVRDFVTKRVEYAAAGIPEYWIVDPEDETLHVLALDGTAYREHGLHRRGAVATSASFAGLELDVTELFDAD